MAKARAISPDAHIIALCETNSYSSRYCASYGANEVVTIAVSEDDCTQAQRIAKALQLLMPDAALFPATVRGRFLSAWTAAKLGTGLTADCTDLSITKDGLLMQRRPAFCGNLMADILCPDRRPQLASVRPRAFPMPPVCKTISRIPERFLDIPDEQPLLQRVGFRPSKERESLYSAKVIVAGGKGVGGQEGFTKLRSLANLLGGAVGATRGAVDAGYISYAHQIGQTGVTVQPELYLCFGVSGSIQHMVGMSGAKTVVAINSDCNAPIFTCADYGIIADWERTADAMIDYLKRKDR